MSLRELHLFAGAGGGILAGMLLGHHCVCAVELDQHCYSVLRARQAEGLLPRFPIFGDVRIFDGGPWRNRVDVVCAGFPCQPWSSAGKRKGTADPRHLWPEAARVIDSCRPALVFLENVSINAFQEPRADLLRMGYHVPPALQVSAGDLGAPHRRNRWWVLAADVDQVRQLALTEYGEVEGQRPAGNADRARLAQRQSERQDPREELAPAVGAAWRGAAPRLRRLVHGHAARVDARRARIAAAGNAQVPQVAAAAFRELISEVLRTP